MALYTACISYNLVYYLIYYCMSLIIVYRQTLATAPSVDAAIKRNIINAADVRPAARF